VKEIPEIPNQTPTADAGKNQEIYEGEAALFDGSAEDSDGEITRYEWNFEGSWEETESGSATHTFITPGTYYVKFRVTDDSDAKDTDTCIVLVNERPVIPNNPPTADAGENQEVYVNEVVIFRGYGADSDGSVEKYEWDFDGDGQYDWNNIQHGITTYIYSQKGVYYAKLRVTDNEGAIGIDTCAILVSEKQETPNIAPLVDAGENQEVFEDETVLFDGVAVDSDGKIVKYEWNFEDTWIETNGSCTTHSFERPGTYFVRFNVTDDDGATAEDACIVLVHEKPEIVNVPPTADAGSDKQVFVDEDIVFHGAATDVDGSIVNYEWDFDGDGIYEWNSTVSGIAVHNYSKEGMFLATFRVTDNEGATDTSICAIKVVIPPEKDKGDGSGEEQEQVVTVESSDTTPLFMVSTTNIILIVIVVYIVAKVSKRKEPPIIIKDE